MKPPLRFSLLHWALILLVVDLLSPFFPVAACFLVVMVIVRPRWFVNIATTYTGR